LENESSSFSLDDLRVEEEEVRAPIILPISIIVCKTEFLKPVENVQLLVSRIKNRLIEKYPFKKGERSKFKEGFLEFNESGNTLECFYAKETPTKINYETDDLKIHTDRLRLINPSFNVKVKVLLKNSGASVIFFGGSELMVRKAMDKVNRCIRHCLEGGHRTIYPQFSKEEMNAILRNFGLDVEYIWISPGESEKFMKLVEKRVKGEIKRVPEYIVHAKLRGYRITVSPITVSLIEESGIYLREIQGRINIAAGIYVTARVSSTGRIVFYIPESIIYKDETVYDVAERLYNKVITSKGHIKQVSMGDFIAEED